MSQTRKWIYTVRLYRWYAWYTVLAMWYVHVSPSGGWTMATANGDEFFKNEYSPYESLMEELSYWDYE